MVNTGIMDPDTETVDDVVEPVEETTESTETTEPVEDWKAKYDELSSKWGQVEPLLPYVSQWAEEAQKREQAELEALLASLESSPEPSTDGTQAPSKDQAEALGKIKQFASLGAQYQKAYPIIMDQTLTLAAIQHASSVLGETATLKELAELATEMKELGDPRLMEKYAGKVRQSRQSSNAQRRSQTGADRTPTANATAGSGTDFDSLEREYAKEGTLSPTKMDRYLKERAARGL